MIWDYLDYRSFLKAVLLKKTKQNPLFSLRSFARFLDIHPAHLSLVLNGNRNISLESAKKVAKSLKLEADETKYFCLMVEFELTNSVENRDAIAKRLKGMIEPRSIESPQIS